MYTDFQNHLLWRKNNFPVLLVLNLNMVLQGKNGLHHFSYWDRKTTKVKHVQVGKKWYSFIRLFVSGFRHFFR